MKPLDLEDRFFKSLGACFVSAFGGTFVFGLIGSVGQLILTTLGTGSYKPAFGLLGLVSVILQGFITTTGLVGGIVFILLCLFGLPVHALLCRFRLSGYIGHVLTATLFCTLFFIGLIGLIGLIPNSLSHTNLERVIMDSAICGALGFLYATIFWLIRRPDLDHKSPDAKLVTPATTP